MNYTNEEKQIIITKYINGSSATTLAKKENISRSTIYYWVSQLGQVNIKDTNFSRNKLRKDYAKLERLEREIILFILK